MKNPRARVVGFCALVSAVAGAAGCALMGVNQGPLASDGPAPSPPGPGRSLVVGGRVPAGEGEDAVMGRNDDALGVRPNGVSVYYGPDGQLLYRDGTVVPFKGVTRQLQDLRTQQRIR